MSEKERDIILKIANKFPCLDEKKQNYVLGYVECLAAVREEQKDNQLQEV